VSKPVILLGAGASVDSGLPTAYGLTEQVYTALRNDASAQRETKLFGFVVAKLIVRQTRLGISPFAKIDIESVYDGLKRVLSKDSDIISEFVNSWDPMTDATFSQFDARAFAENLVRSFRISDRRRLSGQSALSIDNHRLNLAVRELDSALSGTNSKKIDLSNYIETLTTCLTPSSFEHPHITKFLEFCSQNVECVASLNYDLIIERSCESNNISYDYGLKNWNLRRFIKFYGGELNIIKLHGSLNWYFDGDDEIYVGDDRKYRKRAIIFGGQQEKLNANGPFLTLRHEFFSKLRNTNVFAVAGYSFSDEHLNALIRSWIKTRRKAKFIVLNPESPKDIQVIYQNAFRQNKDKNNSHKLAVELVHIKRGFSQGLTPLLDELKSEPNPPDPNSSSAVRVIE
jgi:hypothetical protein